MTHPRFRSSLAAVALGLFFATSAPAQNDRMTPIAAPAQPNAIELGTGTLPNASAPEAWHEQYGSIFARNVSVATLTPFLPDPGKATGTAVVVAPGGGFRTLSMENEGWDVAKALAERGVAAFVLKYRLNQTPADMAAFEGSMTEMSSGAAARPPRPDAAEAFAGLAPQIADARAAFGLIRRRAAEWGVDPDRVGMVGFSAGAMLTMATALAGKDAKPAFIGNIYGPLSPVAVPPDAPPLFVALAADDPLFAGRGMGLIESWQAAKRPVEFHLYEQGGHGFGMYPKETTSTGWFNAFVSWIGMHGMLKPARRAAERRVPGSNPIITDRFTADPAPLVHDGRLYLYVGHDQARGDEMFNMPEWLAYSTEDMRNWTFHDSIMKPTDFKWASKDAWASQVVHKNGRFWLYAAVEHDSSHPGKAIGVAVSDRPTGPFADARGSALVHNQMTPQGPHNWDDIDPTVFTESDGTSWLIWGNAKCYIARLKPNMVELDGPIREITPPQFVEGPWVHKRGGLYYLTYASMDKSKGPDERISYATAPAITGPWTFRGELTGSGKNSFTIHPGIAEFKGNWYFFYHDASLNLGDLKGGLGRRAVRAEHLYYNPDGTIRPIAQTDAGVTAPR